MKYLEKYLEIKAEVKEALESGKTCCGIGINNYCSWNALPPEY